METDYGYHIIKRVDFDISEAEYERMNATYEIQNKILENLIKQWKNEYLKKFVK